MIVRLGRDHEFLVGMIRHLRIGRRNAAVRPGDGRDGHVVIPDLQHPFGMVDEGIPIPLPVGVDQVVPVALEIVRRIQEMPADERAEPAQLGAAGVHGIHQLQVGLAVHVAGVAHVHVEQHAGDVALAGVRRREGAAGRETAGRRAGDVRAAIVEILLAPQAVHLHVGRLHVVRIDRRRHGGAEGVRESMRLRPDVFAVPLAGIAAVVVLVPANLQVDQLDLRGIRRAFVRLLQDRPEGVVAEGHVAANDVVQRLAQFRPRLAVGRKVVIVVGIFVVDDAQQGGFRRTERRPAGGIGQRQRHGFRVFPLRVVQNRNRELLLGDAGGERQRARGGQIVQAARRRAVGRGHVDGDFAFGAAAAPDDDRRRAVAFHHVAGVRGKSQFARPVVVQQSQHGVAGRRQDGFARGRAQGQEDGFRRLVVRIVQDGDGERAGRYAVGERQRAGRRDIVGPGDRRAVRQGIRHGHFAVAAVRPINGNEDDPAGFGHFVRRLVEAQFAMPGEQGNGVESESVRGNRIVVVLLELDLERGGVGQAVRGGNGIQRHFEIAIDVAAAFGGREPLDLHPVRAVHAHRHPVGVLMARERRAHEVVFVAELLVPEGQRDAAPAGEIRRQHQFVQRVVAGRHGFHGQMAGSLHGPVVRRHPYRPGGSGIDPPIVRQDARFERFLERERRDAVVVVDGRHRVGEGAQHRSPAGIEQGDGERFGILRRTIVQNRHVDPTERPATGQGERAAGRHVILARHGGSIGRGKPHRNLAVDVIAAANEERDAAFSLQLFRAGAVHLQRAAGFVHDGGRDRRVVRANRIELFVRHPAAVGEDADAVRHDRDGHGGRAAAGQRAQMGDDAIRFLRAFALAAFRGDERRSDRQLVADDDVGDGQGAGVAGHQAINQIAAGRRWIFGLLDSKLHVRHLRRIVDLDGVEATAEDGQRIVVVLLELDLEVGIQRQSATGGRRGKIEQSVRVAARAGGGIAQLEPVDAVAADRHPVGIGRAHERLRHGFVPVIEIVFLIFEHHVRLPGQIDRQHQFVQAIGVVGGIQQDVAGAFERRNLAGAYLDAAVAAGRRGPAIRPGAGLEPVEKRQGDARHFVVLHDQGRHGGRPGFAGRRGDQPQIDGFVSFDLRIVPQGDGHRPVRFPGREDHGFRHGIEIGAGHGGAVAGDELDFRRVVGQAVALDLHIGHRGRFPHGIARFGKPEKRVRHVLARQRDVVDVPAAIGNGGIGRSQPPAHVNGRSAIHIGRNVEFRVRPARIGDRIGPVLPNVAPRVAIARHLKKDVIVNAALDAQPTLKRKPHVAEPAAIERRSGQIIDRGQVVRISAGQVVAIDVRAGASGSRIGIVPASGTSGWLAKRPRSLFRPAGIFIEGIEVGGIVVPDLDDAWAGVVHFRPDGIGEAQPQRLDRFPVDVLGDRQFQPLGGAAVHRERHRAGGKLNVAVRPRRGRSGGVHFHGGVARPGKHHGQLHGSVRLPDRRGGRGEPDQPVEHGNGEGFLRNAVDVGGIDGAGVDEAHFGLRRRIGQDVGDPAGVGGDVEHRAGGQVAGIQRDLVLVVVGRHDRDGQRVAERNHLGTDGHQRRRLVDQRMAANQHVVEVPRVERRMESKLDVFAGGDVRHAQQRKRKIGPRGRRRKSTQLAPRVRADAIIGESHLAVARRAGIHVERKIGGKIHRRRRQNVVAAERAAIGRALEMAGVVRRSAIGPTDGHRTRVVEIFLQQQAEIGLGNRHVQHHFVGSILVRRLEGDGVRAARRRHPREHVGHRRKSRGRIGSKHGSSGHVHARQDNFVSVEFGRDDRHGHGRSDFDGPVGLRRHQEKRGRRIGRRHGGGAHDHVVQIPGAERGIEPKAHAGTRRQVGRSVQRKILGAADLAGHERAERNPIGAAQGVIHRARLVVAGGAGGHEERQIGRIIHGGRLQGVARSHGAAIGRTLIMPGNAVVGGAPIGPTRRHPRARVEILGQIGERRQGQPQAARHPPTCFGQTPHVVLC